MMAGTEWTPGPWSVRKAKAPTDGAYDYAIGANVGDREQCIAEAFGRVDSEHFTPAEANAHLIAAAPDLYSALEIAHAYARQCGWHLATAASDDTVEKEFSEKLVAAADRMNAALAKARGEKDAA